ncbi:hypothetical protein ACVNP0_11805 [Staphylococcus aureus]
MFKLNLGIDFSSGT